MEVMTPRCLAGSLTQIYSQWQPVGLTLHLPHLRIAWLLRIVWLAWRQDCLLACRWWWWWMEVQVIHGQQLFLPHWRSFALKNGGCHLGRGERAFKREKLPLCDGNYSLQDFNWNFFNVKLWPSRYQLELFHGCGGIRFDSKTPSQKCYITSLTMIDIDCPHDCWSFTSWPVAFHDSNSIPYIAPVTTHQASLCLVSWCIPQLSTQSSNVI